MLASLPLNPYQALATSEGQSHRAGLVGPPDGFRQLFPDEQLQAAETLRQAIVHHGDNSAAALEAMTALRQLARQEHQAQLRIDYQAESQRFICLIGDQAISSHACGPTLAQLNLRETPLLKPQNLSAFVHPLAAVCRMKTEAPPHQTDALACLLQQDESHGPQLAVFAGNQLLLRLPVRDISDADWRTAREAFADLPSDKPSGSPSGPALVPDRLLIEQPAASPWQDIKLAPLLPPPLDIGKLPQMERYPFNWLGRAKDMLVGGLPDPAYKTLADTASRLNAALSALPGLFAHAQERSRSLDASAAEMQDSVKQAENALSAAVGMLEALCQECASLDGQPAGQEAVRELAGSARHAQAQLDELRAHLGTLSQAEAPEGARGKWRMRMEAAAEQIASKPTLSGKTFSAQDKLWLAQLQNALGERQPVTPHSLRDALAKLMLNGAPPPRLDTALLLLDAFYPGLSQARPDPAPLPQAEGFIIDPGSYAQLGEQRAKLLQTRDDKLCFLHLLNDAGKAAAQSLRKEQEAITASGEYKTAAAQRNIQVTALERFCLMRWRDPAGSAQKHAEKARSGLEASIDISGLDDLAMVDDSETTLDGVLFLLARSGVATVGHDGLQLNSEDFVAEDTQVGAEALQAYATLDSATRGQLQAAARQCLQLQHQLEHQAAHRGLPQLTFHAAVEQQKLLPQFKAHPDEHLAFFKQRAQLLQAYEGKLAQLAQLLSGLPKDGDASLAATLAQALEHVRVESQMFAAVLDAAAPLADVDRLQRASQLQKSESPKWESRLAAETQPFAGELAGINLKIYQLRSQAIKDTIQATANLSRLRADLQQSLDEAASILHDAYDPQGGKRIQDIIQENPRAAAAIRYQNLQQKLDSAQREISHRSAQFRLALLSLQQEERRANSAGGGGYPKDVYWSSWLASMMGDSVASLAGEQLDKPRDLLLQHQLALTGKSMSEARQDMLNCLAKLPSDPKQALEELGFTPRQLLAWASAYPQELAHLSSNLNHVYHALTATGKAAFLGDMFNTAWQRGTMDSVMQDALFGKREALVGIEEGQTLPPALIALLSMADWAPYAVGGVKGVLSQNIGGVLAGGVGATLLGTGVGAGIATAMLQFMGGAAQTQVEKGIADKVAEHRNINVAVNAVLNGMGLGSEASIGDRLKSMASYAMQREALRNAGTIGRDIAQAGKLGPMERALKEVSLTWKHASIGQKALLVAAAVAAPLAAGALLGLLAAGPLGWAAAGIIAACAMAASAALGTHSLWSTLTSWLMPGLDRAVQKELNDEILGQALQKARDTLARRVKEQQVSISQRQDIQPEALQSLAQQALDARLARLARDLQAEPGFADCTEAEIGLRFDQALLHAAPDDAPAFKLDDDSEAFLQAGVDKALAMQIREKIEQSLKNAVRFQPAASM